MPWPRPERQPQAPIRARIRLHRSIVGTLRFRKSLAMWRMRTRIGESRASPLCAGTFGAIQTFFPHE
jgi:hypothetical protein